MIEFDKNKRSLPIFFSYSDWRRCFGMKKDADEDDTLSDDFEDDGSVGFLGLVCLDKKYHIKSVRICCSFAMLIASTIF
jgi:hypothetical protein